MVPCTCVPYGGADDAGVGGAIDIDMGRVDAGVDGIYGVWLCAGDANVDMDRLAV